MSYTNITQTLKAHGLRPTQQRIAVYRYLCEHPCHPTAEAIYENLRPSLPSCSLMTVYNCLDALVRAELIRVVTIEAGVQHFDADVTPHGHFRCSACGTIYDFPFPPESVPAHTLVGFQITEQNLYCAGVCPNCLSER